MDDFDWYKLTIVESTDFRINVQSLLFSNKTLIGGLFGEKNYFIFTFEHFSC